MASPEHQPSMCLEAAASGNERAGFSLNASRIFCTMIGHFSSCSRAFARQKAMLKKEERFIERFEKNAAKASQVQSRVKKLDKIERVAPPRWRNPTGETSGSHSVGRGRMLMRR